MRFIIVLITSLFVLSLSSFAQNKKPRTGKESLFGKKLATYQITSNELSGACFYLVSGHGGPDPGAIGIYQGRQLHEDEYAYDIILRLARELLTRGAKVHIIIRDKKDGIRDGHILSNSKRETCMGDPIPLNQVERLKQRCKWVDKLWIAEAKESKRMYSFIMHRVAVKANVWRIICIAPLIRNTTSTSRTGDLPGR